MANQQPNTDGRLQDTKPCPLCDKLMIKRYRKEIMLTNPPQQEWYWWCGNDGHEEVGGVTRGISDAESNRLQWEQANKPKMVLSRVTDEPANTERAQLRAWRQERG